MKAIILLFLATSKLLSQPNIDFYTLPQDYNHFIYFLQKKFSKVHQNITIASSRFDLSLLKNVMIKNSTSKFNLFIKKDFKAHNFINSLALYPHINIYICQKIPKQIIRFNHTIIRSQHSLEKQVLTKTDQKLTLTTIEDTENLYLLQLKRTCKHY